MPPAFDKTGLLPGATYLLLRTAARITRVMISEFE
jgi:hypothetical protein